MLCLIIYPVICLFVCLYISVWLYVSAVLGGCFINGSIPLFYELTIETTYPIAEGIPMAVVTTSNHVACLLFLGALMIPGIGEKMSTPGPNLAPRASLLPVPLSERESEEERLGTKVTLGERCVTAQKTAAKETTALPDG